MIVVLLWLALAWLVRPVGDVGSSWWSSLATMGHEVAHSGAGTIVGLVAGSILLCILGAALARKTSVRRMVGASSVTLSVIFLAGVGMHAWPICLTLMLLAGACTRDESMASVAELAVLGLVLGGSRAIKGMIVSAITGSNAGVVGAERLFVLVSIIILGASALYFCARQVGVFGERYLSAWVERAWQARKGGAKAKETDRNSKKR